MIVAPAHTYTDDGITEASQVADAFLARYAKNSALFFTEVLELEPLPWQRAVLAQYDARLRRIAIKSGHGVGKGYLIAGIGVHHQACRFPQKTIMTAPSAPQLFNAAWNDVKIFVQRLPKMMRDLFEVYAESIELRASPNESFMSARTARADQPEAMQGLRSSGSTLFLADEAAGIDDAIFQAVDGSLSGGNATMILTGNPTRNSGYFYRAFHENSAMWALHTVSCYDVPHVSREYIEEKRQEYGEESAEFAYRVLGEFPGTDEDTVIPAHLATAAMGRDVHAAPSTPVVWGLDVARQGGDRSALCKRQGNVVLEPVKTWRESDTMAVVGHVLREFKTTPFKLRPTEICVDVIGYGAGVVDRLRELQSEMPGVEAIRAVNVQESPSVMAADRFLNLRSELWYAGRDWLAARDCHLPPEDKMLYAELVAVRNGPVTSKGQVRVEEKIATKKRLRRSPDVADAFLLTFASLASRVLGGGRSSRTSKALADFQSPYV